MARPKRTTPWLAKRDNGIFYAWWWVEGERTPRRLSMETRSSAEAEARFGEFLINGRELRQSKISGAYTAGQALDDYMAEHVLRKCAAPERHEYTLWPLKQFYGDTPLRDIDIASSLAYAAGRTDGSISGGPSNRGGVGPATVRRELAVLVAAANHAVRTRKPTAASVQVELPNPAPTGRDDEVPYLTSEELESLFEEADKVGDDTRLFVRLLYFTGARRRSIEDLRRNQVRWDTRRIMLKPADKRATKKRQPIVPILKAMEPVVSELLETGGEDRLFKHPSYYVRFRKLAEAAGVAEGKRHPHIMRHTRATHLLQRGVSLYDVAKALGDTFATVERVYGHHSAESLALRLED